jgi:hypothetical protein
MYTKKLQRFVLSILISLCFGIGFAEGSISMSGTYTISAAGTGEYTYIRDAVSDLVQYGISGPVIFPLNPENIMNKYPFQPFLAHHIRVRSLFNRLLAILMMLPSLMIPIQAHETIRCD